MKRKTSKKENMRTVSFMIENTSYDDMVRRIDDLDLDISKYIRHLIKRDLASGARKK